MIRLAVAADCAAVTACVEAAFALYVPRIGRKPMPMLHDYAAVIAAGQVHVLEDGDAMVGFIMLVPEPDHLLVDTVSIWPDLQGRGHGRRLLAFAEDEARRLGLAELRLYTNAAMTENVAMYPRLGYVETGRGGQDGFQRVFFAKRL
jgi:GNAT superfamily N-acetyltransferase